MENGKVLNPDDFEDEAERFVKKGGGGGKKKRVFGEARRGQRIGVENTENRKNKTDRELREEVAVVVVERFDDKVPGAFDIYEKWLLENINSENLLIKEEEFGKWEQMTASVKAGGGGRQTSRNARGRRHLPTGFRATAEEDRKASPNEVVVMKKLVEQMEDHLDGWRKLLGKDGVVDIERLSETLAEIVEEKAKNNPTA